MYKKHTKRAVDLALGTILLLVALPFMAVIAALLAVTQGRPIVFRQMRPGLDGQPFTVLKFRTMRPGPEADRERLTSLGRALRRLSLDELPTLFNVVRGDMSLVGPRPLLMQYVPLYSQEQARRHEVRPGVTGWAQVHGRNALSWSEKFRHDVWYVDNVSFLLDMRILIMSVTLVVRGTGVRQPGRATTEYFRGNAE